MDYTENISQHSHSIFELHSYNFGLTFAIELGLFSLTFLAIKLLNFILLFNFIIRRFEPAGVCL